MHAAHQLVPVTSGEGPHSQNEIGDGKGVPRDQLKAQADLDPELGLHIGLHRNGTENHQHDDEGN